MELVFFPPLSKDSEWRREGVLEGGTGHCSMDQAALTLQFDVLLSWAE